MKEMDSSEGEKANTQPTREQRMQSVLDLSNKFGGSSKIPEEELSAIGYVRRVAEDGMVHLMPLERMEELAQKDPDWEKPIKDRERPFGRVAVELSTSEHSFRFVPRTQRQLLSDRLEAVEYAFYPNWRDGTSIMGELNETDSRLHNLRTFTLDFLNSLRGLNIFEEVPEEDAGSAAEEFIFAPLPERKSSEEFDPSDPNDFLYKEFKEKYSELDGSVTSLASRKIYDELTRLNGYFTDLQELDRSFKDNLKGETLSEGRRKSEPELTKFLESHGIYSFADFIRYAFPKYLKKVGLPEIGEAIATSTELQTLVGRLQQLDTLDISRSEEQELRKALKTASPESRNILSKQLKNLDDAKKKRRQIRQGVLDYFASPQLYADVVKRKVKEAQDFFIAGKGEQRGHALFYLDANPNQEIDRDPGIVSGDCTAGKALPFDRSDIPLYNVKVFSSGDEHLGNIYLLVTKTTSEDRDLGDSQKKKVWHFDAIQIPRSGINWRGSLEVLVEALAKQADARGIDAITANSELHHISNYDYIANAVRDYWADHGRQMVRITIPQVEDSDDYSSMQGTGEAIVLWSKEKLSDAYEGELEVNQELFDLQNDQH